MDYWLLILEGDIVLEVWKDAIGYEGLYQVSNLGRVRSIDRVTTCLTRWGTSSDRHYKSKVLNPSFDGKGHYLFVVLRKDGKSYTEQVHRLVAKTFLPLEDYSLDVNHKDGNKTNNIVDNLEWCTRSRNLEHALEIGLMESQCKIRRKVNLTFDGNKEIAFPDMISCCNFFNHSKSWLGNYVRKHGNPCRYGKYTICVSERE